MGRELWLACPQGTVPKGKKLVNGKDHHLAPLMTQGCAGQEHFHLNRKVTIILNILRGERREFPSGNGVYKDYRS